MEFAVVLKSSVVSDLTIEIKFPVLDTERRKDILLPWRHFETYNIKFCQMTLQERFRDYTFSEFRSPSRAMSKIAEVSNSQFTSGMGFNVKFLRLVNKKDRKLQHK